VVESPIIDASPLIFLSKAGKLDLLQQVAAGMDVMVPVAVETEIQQYGAEDVTVQALAHWLVVVDTPPIPKVIQSYHLGAGESAVLTGAYLNPNTEAIIVRFSSTSLCRGFGYSSTRYPWISTDG